MSEWKDIATAELGKPVLLWGPGWRRPFPGMRIGDNGQVWIDTCEVEAKGRQEHATHWMPEQAPPGSTESRAVDP